MNPKLRTVLIVIGLITLLIVGIFVVPRGLSLYLQIKGGQNVEYVLHTSEGIQELVCEQLPAKNEDSLNEIKQAVIVLNRAVMLNKNNSQAYYSLGKANCLLGNHSEAAKNFEQYTQLRPNNPLGYIRLGFAQEQLGDVNSAVTSWKSAELEAQDFIETSKEEFNYRNYIEAILWLNRVSFFGEDIESSLYYYQSQLKDELDDRSSAEAMLENAIEVDHGWIDQDLKFRALANWGKWLFQDGQYKRAQTILLNAIDIFKHEESSFYTLSEVYRYLALSQKAQDKLEESSQSFLTSIVINNNNTLAHLQYGKLLFELDPMRVQDIENEFNYAINQDPSDPWVWDYVIQFWLEINMPNKAEELCKEAVILGLNHSDLSGCIKD